MNELRGKFRSHIKIRLTPRRSVSGRTVYMDAMSLPHWLMTAS